MQRNIRNGEPYFLSLLHRKYFFYSTSHLSNDREVQRLAGLDLTTEIWNCNNRVLWKYKHLDYIVFRVVPSRPVAASCIVRQWLTSWQVRQSDGQVSNHQEQVRGPTNYDDVCRHLSSFPTPIVVWSHNLIGKCLDSKEQACNILESISRPRNCDTYRIYQL